MTSRLSHQFRLLRKLSFQKTWNALLLYVSYCISRLSGLNTHAGSPLSIAIEPTTACNLRCPECPSGLRSFSRKTGNLNKDSFKSFVDQIHKNVAYLTFYFQGEPYLNPDFLEMTRYASEKGMITSTSTNAHFLNDVNARETVESGLDRLIISIDGTDQKTYSSYRKEGNLDKVIRGTKNVIRWKKELNSAFPEIVFQFLVVRPNEHQIEEVKSLGRKLGVDRVVLKSAQIYDYEKGSPLIPENIRYSRYKKKKDGTWEIKNKLLNHCWRMWSSCVVTWDGNLVPCCFDKDASHKAGNVFTESFDKVWKGVELAGFRKQVLTGRDQVDICKNCSEGTRVWV